MSERKDSLNEWYQDSPIFQSNIEYLEFIYESYLKNPDSIEKTWKKYFQSIQNNQDESFHSIIRDDFISYFKDRKLYNAKNSNDTSVYQSIMKLINDYRSLGHKFANTNPLESNSSFNPVNTLNVKHYGINNLDLQKKFYIEGLSDNKEAVLSEVLDNLSRVYLGSIGYEYMHLNELEERNWLSQQIENKSYTEELSIEQKKWLLRKIVAAEGLEKYLGMRYVGQKRFSLEGSESLIPAMSQILSLAANANVLEIGIGMAHRGRLNVLVNIMGKSASQLFKEFEDTQDKKFLSGDVKYHLGFSSWHKFNDKNLLKLSLAFNPSHLEAVNPVVEGSIRAKQDFYGDNGKQKIIPLLIHGDSSFCGQGIVMETLALSKTRYFNTGGTIHIVVNNQVGFTTSKIEDNRSSYYCTDIAKMIEAPVFHVNSNDPEAVLRVSKLAFEYRMKFNKDVIIDLICYRKHGHNEADEPSGTQPRMYAQIKKIDPLSVIYSNKLNSMGIIDGKELSRIQSAYKGKIQAGNIVCETLVDFGAKKPFWMANWKPYTKQAWNQSVDTGIDKSILVSLAKEINKVPKELVLQNQVKKVILEREKMTNEEVPCNWGFAENLAYATILHEGFNVRVSGEDTGRGTFSHRHAVLHNFDFNNKALSEFIPLKHINKNSICQVIDSILSEYGVLGFEYGYSCAAPKSLVIWEAQFGDFSNTAQVIIDQFIASAEEKWGILSGLVMFLPHGQEGAGAEHSSARLERFLQLCANNNIQVCNPTTPAQLFHMLRRQVIRIFRKPLIVMSPKSLLRHSMVFSTMEELSNGSFQTVIAEHRKLNDIQRVIICSGKVYYDLLKMSIEKNITNIAIIRLEQLYPFPVEELVKTLESYSQVYDIVWVQEEPENQGSWHMIQHYIRKILLENQRLSYIGRKFSSVPAVGYSSSFNEQQQSLLRNALLQNNV